MTITDFCRTYNLQYHWVYKYWKEGKLPKGDPVYSINGKKICGIKWTIEEMKEIKEKHDRIFEVKKQIQF